jgi:hypothetical protein
MAVAREESGLPVSSISTPTSTNASDASSFAVSRKRPLNEDSTLLSHISPSRINGKLRRCSTVTCSFGNICSSTNDNFAVNSNNKSNRRISRVRFGSFTTFVVAGHSISEEERKELWYGLDECAQLNNASKEHIKDFRNSEHKDVMRHVLCVASQCSYSPPPIAYLQTVRLNIPDEARGLELGLLPLRIRQRRQEHVKRVVEVQKQILAGTIPLKNDEQIKAKALAIQSMRSSQASRLFAELLARNVAAD